MSQFKELFTNIKARVVSDGKEEYIELTINEIHPYGSPIIMVLVCRIRSLRIGGELATDCDADDVERILLGQKVMGGWRVRKVITFPIPFQSVGTSLSLELVSDVS
jgi:hypothetical protein